MFIRINFEINFGTWNKMDLEVKKDEQVTRWWKEKFQFAKNKSIYKWINSKLEEFPNFLSLRKCSNYGPFQVSEVQRFRICVCSVTFAHRHLCAKPPENFETSLRRLQSFFNQWGSSFSSQCSLVPLYFLINIISLYTIFLIEWFVL